MAIGRLLDECPNVDGLFASNDLVAASFIAEARKRGKDIPNDIKVVGYDEMETCQILLPELTTIRQPIAQIAKTAVGLLIKEIEDEYHDLPLETYLPVELIEGHVKGANEMTTSRVLYWKLSAYFFLLGQPVILYFRFG